MDTLKSKDFWIGVAATFVILKFVAPRIPAVNNITSKLS